MEQQMQAGGVTCILTSCGRFDLLERTLESFFKFNTYDVKDFIVADDSSKIIPVDLRVKYPFIKWFPTTLTYNQIYSLDTLWSMVKTPYAFTMEDDWEFTREGFIEDSMKVLEDDPTILQVWLHEMEEHNRHPVQWLLGKNYGILKTDGNLWSGTRFAPALKRKKDYDLIAPFSKYTTFNRNKPWKAEADISKLYHARGFKAAIFEKPYIHHIGQNRHVS